MPGRDDRMAILLVMVLTEEDRARAGDHFYLGPRRMAPITQLHPGRHRGAAELSNVFAGVVLLLARPVDVGDPVLIRSGAMGGELRGKVVEIGIAYVRLDTSGGPLHLPNSQVLASEIAPVVSKPPDQT